MTIAFVSAASLVPFVGLVALLLLPLVLYVLSMRNDPMRVLVAFLTALVVFLVILSFMHAVLPVLAMAAAGLAGLLMAWTARKNYSIEFVVLLPALVFLCAMAIYFVFGGMQLSISPWQLVERHITEAVDMNIKLYSQLPLGPDEIKSIQESKPAVVQLFTRLFPALCAIAALFTVWLNTLIGNRLLRQYGVIPPKLSALSEWKAPNGLVWFFIAGGGLGFIPHIPLSFAGINVFLVAAFIYLLQGLAIVSFFFQSKDISLFFRWLFYFLIAIQQILMIAITAVGFFDIWIDFRKYFRKNQTTDLT
ncbi:MAG: YybS family protein [Deltaproteobacteria bacterium]